MNLLFFLLWAGFTMQGGQGADYPSLAARFRAGDETVDLRELRFACGRDPKCEFSSDTEGKMVKEFAAQRCEQAIRLADKVLANNVVEPHAYFVQFVCHKQLGASEKSETQRKVLARLMASYTQGGMDGKTLKTAIPVTEVHEEYAYMDLHGIRRGSQSFSPQGGHFYDVMVGFAEDGSEQKIYFNVDAPNQRLSDALRSVDDKPKPDKKTDKKK
jgi:hypothetical protein